MGTITFQVVGDGSVGTKTKTYTVSDADVNRLVAFAQAIAANNGVSNPNVTQGLLAWADRMMSETKTGVRAYEQAIAAAAIAAITAT